MLIGCYTNILLLQGRTSGCLQYCQALCAGAILLFRVWFLFHLKQPHKGLCHLVSLRLGDFSPEVSQEC